MIVSITVDIVCQVDVPTKNRTEAHRRAAEWVAGSTIKFEEKPEIHADERGYQFKNAKMVLINNMDP